MLVIRADIHKMLDRIENREDPDQTASKKQSDLGLHCWLSIFGRQLVLKMLEHLL